MTGDDPFQRTLSWYLDNVLPADTDTQGRTDPGRAILPPPGHAPVPANIRRALSRPRTLLDPTNTDVRTVFKVLMSLAWLADHWPVDWIPRDLASRMARFQFLVWSFPARFGVGASAEIYDGVQLPELAEQPRPEVDDEFLFAQARLARQHWKQYLDSWEDDPWLASRQDRAPDALESDLAWLVIAWPSPNKPWSDALDGAAVRHWPRGLSSLDLGSVSDGHRVAADTAQHWLHRGSLGGAATALAPTRRAEGRGLLAVYPVAAAVLITLLLTGSGDLARWGAVGLLVFAIAATVVVPARFTPLGLLRVPAAAAVGLAVLVTLSAQWWITPAVWLIGVGMAVFAGLYLVFEARQHGAGVMAAVYRGAINMLVGLLHAAVLSIAVLGFVVPAMGQNGSCLAGWEHHDPWAPLPISASVAGLPAGSTSCAAALGVGQAAAPAAMLMLMTGWSLAIGLAAQILWDDRPVTAPLGRLRRVRGGS
ncbi:MAG TPA: hypothetical protein VFW65_07810 [Pseudonocardiaceae bacterium]|nr:hypothetical protein [Pseudonocardiaceae bacterium]